MTVPESKTEVMCDACGVSFVKATYSLGQHNYCSKVCAGKAKRVEGAKWRDPAQIKQYMHDWQSRQPREVINEKNRQWVAENPEKRTVIRANSRAKVKNVPGRLTVEQWTEVLERHDRRCAMCGTDKSLSMDHIKPISRGGVHTVDNVQPLCKSCNSRKSDRILDVS